MARKKHDDIKIEGVSLEEAFAEYKQSEMRRVYLEMELAEIIEPLEQARADAERSGKRLALVMDRDERREWEDEDIEVQMIKQRLVEYNARKLPMHVRSIPGVIVEKVDKSTIDRALDNGVIDEEDVSGARSEKFKEPYIRMAIKTGE